MTEIDARYVLPGRGVSEGIAIGNVVVLQSRDLEVFRFPVPEERLVQEVDRLREAINRTRREIGRTRQQVREQVGEDLAGVFDAYDLILADELFAGAIEELVRRERVNAEWAVDRVSQELGERFARIESEHLRERGDDLRDVTRYLLRSLQGISHHQLSEIAGGGVVVADELTPSDALRLGRQGILGLALEGGGPNSHTTIVARALNLPLVVGLGEIASLVQDDQPAILDGNEGLLLVEPGELTVARYRLLQGRLRERDARFEEGRELPAVTRDGVEVKLLANIEFPDEIEEALRFGAAGIGLYRSEFLYIEHSPALPTEEEHYLLFRRMLEVMAPRPVTVRTFDLGGRKLARDVMATDEENPSLGLRGIRLTLARPAIFRTQLRALYRAACHGELSIMVPLVSSIEEIRLFKGFCDNVLAELRSDGVEHSEEVRYGAMIEVPSAALIVDRLARELDFLSIGTNDLIQYTLAVDRSNEHVAGLYQPLHPAILEIVSRVVSEGDRAGIEVSLCGEMAANPHWVPLLIGAGLRSLSMSPRSIPEVKQRIRRLSAAVARRVLSSSLRADMASEVEALLRAHAVELGAEEDGGEEDEGQTVADEAHAS